MRLDARHMTVKVFADGADIEGILALYSNPVIKGFTTNPTLMRKAGVKNYEAFAREVLDAVPDRPISFEVFSDDFVEMQQQALKIALWGDNVYVKIPVTDTNGERSDEVITRLVKQGVKVNVTALMTVDQVKWVADCLIGGPPAYISVFAGRVADTGRDPVPLMSEALDVVRPMQNVELIWASPREVLNIVQADAIGCHIITVTHDLLKKLPTLGKDLSDFSLDTVRMFHADGVEAGYSL
ncbi:MAG TPA: transaldolase [Acidimicrobiia bacterium]|nr:transaldolase [Acidimicrobiia bacterium]